MAVLLKDSAIDSAKDWINKVIFYELLKMLIN